MEIFALLYLALAIAFMLAQFKLFSIDKTLKEISNQLKAIVPAPAVTSSEALPPKMVSKDVWACTNCAYAIGIDRDKPSRCGNCGAKHFEQKTIQVKADTV